MSRRVDTLEIKEINSRNKFPSRGLCAEIKNLRKKNGVWGNVSEFSAVRDIQIPSEYRIIFIHCFDDKQNYIAEKSGSVYYITLGGTVQEIKLLCDNINDKSPIISGFGSYLCVKYAEEVPVVEVQYVWKNGGYVKFDLEQLVPLNDIEFESETKNCDDYNETLVAEITVFDNVNFNIQKKNNYYASRASTLENDGYVTGIVYFFFAYKLFDGALVKSSKIYIFPSQEGVSATIEVEKNDTTYNIYSTITGCKVSFVLELPEELFENDLVDSIVVCSTRDNPLLDIDKIELLPYMADATYYNGTRRSVNSKITYVSDAIKDSLQSPFYQLKEFPLSEFTDCKYSATLTKEDFEDVVFKEIYTANYSHHKTTSLGNYEYNNRVHRYGIHTSLYSGYHPFLTVDEVGEGVNAYVKTYNDDEELICVVYLEGDTEKTYVAYRTTYYIYVTSRGFEEFLTPSIISYPDARAKSMTLYFTHEGECCRLKTFTLTPSYSLNYSYYVDHSNGVVNDVSRIYCPKLLYDNLPEINNLLVENNKIIVSNFGNPYTYEPACTYYIGEINSTKIFNVSSVLSDNNDGNTGYYPFNVFTSDGIYKLEQGKDDVLYDTIKKVSKDVLLGGSNILSADRMLFFITERGLVSMIDTRIEYISHNFNDKDLEYFKSAHILSLTYYNEIMVYNEGYNFAYIYSIDEKSWVKRDIIGEVLSDKELYDGCKIVDFTMIEDEKKPMCPYFMTREIDYGNMGLTRFDTVTIDLRTNALVAYTFIIYGSVDMENWFVIGLTTDISRIRRTSSSWRYFKFELKVDSMSGVMGNDNSEGVDPAEMYLSSIMIEFYPRFIHRLNQSDSGNPYMK